jgi:uncharacterized protein (TIGR02466 family)
MIFHRCRLRRAAHRRRMPVRAWFPTQIYCEPLQPSGLDRLNTGLAAECRQLRDFDAAGRRWSAQKLSRRLHELRLNERAAPVLQHLRRPRKKAHCATPAPTPAALEFDLRGRTVRLTDCWVNIMPPTAAHSLHLHPLSFISGTYYVATPPGCPGLKFEDPRLSKFMAAPPRRPDARPEHRPHVTYPAEAGNVILFESWLRHEVPANRVAEERISVSFNFNWA